MNDKPQITTGDDLASKIESTRYSYFTLPNLDVTIKYRKPDLLKLSFNGDLPAAMAALVIQSYKDAVSGSDLDEIKEKASHAKIDANDELVKDLGSKGYSLLKQLCISHKIIDVAQSDPSNDIIAWADIPEEDAIAFLIFLIGQANKSAGGEVSTEEATSFPNKGRRAKRNTAG